MKDEDLIHARDKLASGTAVKGKTFEVMEECGELNDDPVSIVTQSVFVCLCVCHTKEKNKNSSACLVGYKICLCARLGFAGVSTPYKVAEGLKTRAHGHTNTPCRETNAITQKFLSTPLPQ